MSRHGDSSPRFGCRREASMGRPRSCLPAPHQRRTAWARCAGPPFFTDRDAWLRARSDSIVDLPEEASRYRAKTTVSTYCWKRSSEKKDQCDSRSALAPGITGSFRWTHHHAVPICGACLRPSSREALPWRVGLLAPSFPERRPNNSAPGDIISNSLVSKIKLSITS